MDTLKLGLETLYIYIRSVCVSIYVNLAQKQNMLWQKYPENVYDGTYYFYSSWQEAYLCSGTHCLFSLVVYICSHE
jgi:hypothetical protein